MQVDQYVLQVQTQLAAAAAVGDETTRATAEALVSAAEPAVRLALLTALSAAANEITAALLDSPGAPVVSVQFDGDDLRVEVRLSDPGGPAAEAAPAGPDEAENTARISLRLPDALKAEIEAAARAGAISVNAWILRAASSALSGSARLGRRASLWETGGGKRISGWVNS